MAYDYYTLRFEHVLNGVLALWDFPGIGGKMGVVGRAKSADTSSPFPGNSQ